jgi:hypothetical protein
VQDFSVTLNPYTPSLSFSPLELIGAYQGNSGSTSLLNNFFTGSIADVQVYNTTFDANAVQYLYLEGIGGVPISPQYLVGWWPLNGDAIDYSGNGDNGVPTNIIFNGTWTQSYTAP